MTVGTVRLTLRVLEASRPAAPSFPGSRANSARTAAGSRADSQERGIRSGEGIAFNLSSAGKTFHAVAVLQLAQQGRLQLTDAVGRHLTGLPADVAAQVTVHDLLSGTSGTGLPEEDVQRVFSSRDEVHAHHAQRVRQVTRVGVPGLPDAAHAEAEVTLCALIVEAVTGTSYWDYVPEKVFTRSGMTRSGFFTRPQRLTDVHLAHPYMAVAGGDVVDAVRHGPASFGGQWIHERSGGNPGDRRHLVPLPDTGWIGVILTNRDGAPLQERPRRTITAWGHGPAGAGRSAVGPAVSRSCSRPSWR